MGGFSTLHSLATQGLGMGFRGTQQQEAKVEAAPNVDGSSGGECAHAEEWQPRVRCSAFVLFYFPDVAATLASSPTSISSPCTLSLHSSENSYRPLVPATVDVH